MPRKVSSRVSSVYIRSDQQVDDKVLKREEFKTLKRGDKAILTPNGDLRYHIDLSTKVTVQDNTIQVDIKDGTPTCHEPVKDNY